MSRSPIYVEIKINSTLDDLWHLTQAPDKHELWDLRFTEINYLPRSSDHEPQRFLYTTRIGFGLKIWGEGETVGSHHRINGTRTSALKFGSTDPKSLIRAGSGYWQYIPIEPGVRFLTWYDYETRFGLLGQWFDQLIFRPLLGWATAWSFDRLRLWLEKGIPPTISLHNSLSYLTTRLVLSFIWIYQGAFPKLLFQDTGELGILRGSGLFAGQEPLVLTGLGLAEVTFGLLFLLWWQNRRIFMWNIILLFSLTLGAFFSRPLIFVEPFNPITLNLAMIGLSLTGLWSAKDLPSARNCLRQPKG